MEQCYARAGALSSLSSHASNCERHSTAAAALVHDVEHVEVEVDVVDLESSDLTAGWWSWLWRPALGEQQVGRRGPRQRPARRGAQAVQSDGD
jgi:hypothetical protein